MKNRLLFIFLIGSTFIYSQNENPYASFKTGTFLYQAGKHFVVIKRTKKKQVEKFDGGKIILNINWTSDSTFILTVKKIKGAPSCLSKGDWLKATIIKAEGIDYTVKYSSENCGERKTVYTKVEKEL